MKETLTITLLLICATLFGQSTWKAPMSSGAIKNPIEPSEETILKGQVIYSEHCLECHGLNQKLDSPKLSTQGEYLTADKLKDQSDGSLHWKIIHGKDTRHAYHDILNDDEIWEIILYLRTVPERTKSE